MPPPDNNDLQARIEELERADRAKDQFLALLSHELRNHIHAIRTNAWLIKARVKDPETVRPTDAIDRQVVKLSKLVEDLLDIIRVSKKGQLVFDTTTIQQVVGAAVETVRTSLDAHRRELTVSLPNKPLFVSADAPRLQQAIGNVIDNAIKYSPQQAPIKVKVTQDGDHALVSVKDRGLGIAKEKLPGLFNLYIDGPAVRKPTSEGLGIGLHVARELVEGHGGTIQAHSEGVGEGSEFIMCIPLTVARQPASPSIHMEASEEAPTPLSILVVDDNHDAADSLAQVLEAYGHRVQAAYGGEEAVELAAKGDVQVALVDIGMPTVDGFQVAERISKTPAARDTLLVAVTGWGEKSDRTRSKQAGFAYHLTKPVDFDALASLLATAARRVTR